MSETFFPLAFWEKKFCIYKLPRNVLFIIETSMKYQTIWLFFLAVKGAIYQVACHSNSDIFTCEDNMLFSHVKISCFCVGWNWLSLSLRCFIAVPSLGKGQYRDNKSPKFLGWLISNSCYLFLVQWLCFCKIIFCHLHILPSCSASLFSPSLFCGVSRSLAWLLTLLALALRLRVLLPLLALPLCKKIKKG